MRKKFEEWLSESYAGDDYDKITDKEKDDFWKLIEGVCNKILKEVHGINPKYEIKDSKYHFIISYIFDFYGIYEKPKEINDDIISDFYQRIMQVNGLRL